MSTTKTQIPQYDHKRAKSGHPQKIVVYYASELVDVLQQILQHNKNAVVHSGQIHFDRCVGVTDTNGNVLAYIITRLDQKGPSNAH